MLHNAGTVLSADTVECDCGEQFPTEPHPEPDHWESPLLDAHVATMRAAVTVMHLSTFGYRTACGLHMDNSRNITRYNPETVTCGNCRRHVK